MVFRVLGARHSLATYTNACFIHELVKNGYFVNVAIIGTIKQFVASGGLSHCQGCTSGVGYHPGQKRSVWPEVERLA